MHADFQPFQTESSLLTHLIKCHLVRVSFKEKQHAVSMHVYGCEMNCVDVCLWRDQSFSVGCGVNGQRRRTQGGTKVVLSLIVLPWLCYLENIKGVITIIRWENMLLSHLVLLLMEAKSGQAKKKNKKKWIELNWIEFLTHTAGFQLIFMISLLFNVK